MARQPVPSVRLRVIDSRLLVAAALTPALLVACGHGERHVVCVSPTADTARAADAKKLVDAFDTRGLADAAARLCVPLASPSQRELGLAAAKLAQEKEKEQSREGSLLVARCGFFVADTATDADAVRAAAEEGLHAATRAGTDDPVAAYWAGLTLGLLIQQQGIAAVGRLGEVTALLETARRQPEQDLGGPLRVLGMMYLRAPAWPAGPGDLDTALELLREAAQSFPEHPLNHLFLAEALLAAGERDAARTSLARAQELALPEIWGPVAARWRYEADALGEKLAR